MMRFYKSKKGAGDGFAWFVATVVIFFIVILFIGVYSIAGLAKKVDVTVSSDIKGAYFDNLFRQRMSGYFINYGIDMGDKGNFSYYIYSGDGKGLKPFIDNFCVKTFGSKEYMKLMFLMKDDYPGGFEEVTYYQNLDMGVGFMETRIPLYFFDAPIYFSIDWKTHVEKFWLVNRENVLDKEGKI